VATIIFNMQKMEATIQAAAIKDQHLLEIWLMIVGT